MNSELSVLISALIPIVEKAGRAIATVRSDRSWSVQNKSDDSPFTQADLAANKIIVEGIAAISDDPIVSEESVFPKMKGNRFWLVDPLDGTRDFIAGEETFVICVALIEDSKPILGIIHAPISKETWHASVGEGAFNSKGRIRHSHPKRPLKAVGSRSMPSDRMKLLYEMFGIETVDRFGSALKFCKIAQGDYDVYPRFGPTSEWDTAAGQVICEEAGCLVVSLKTGQALNYGKSDFRNEGFIVIRGDANVPDLLSRLRSKNLLPS
ncbi:MAG TPA: 3'(2'),5'-bisphosphate nucleotidase CysQ [Bdellovibrionales bacterium]|nr:3'(2'),5'-bisphosphate nucleotidase CysQ [Bdellovibrionales bacterium]